MDDRQLIDLATGLPVTPEDRVMLRRLGEQTPSWLDLDWRTIAAMLPPEALSLRPTANDTWRQFSLD